MDRNSRMGEADDVWEIDNGWEVVASDGEKIGEVDEVHPYYLTVSKGFLFPTERYVPVDAIASVEQQRVHLGFSKSQIDSMGWDTIPNETTTEVDSGVVRTDRQAEMVEGDEDLRVPLVEEELDVRTRNVERGRVLVRKGVTSEERMVNVPLREEEVRVERRAVDSTMAGDQVPDDAFQEMEIEIPLRGEEAEVSKRAVVREEVEIDKDVVQREERVTDTVRREEVHVEGDNVTETDARP